MKEVFKCKVVASDDPRPSQKTKVVVEAENYYQHKINKLEVGKPVWMTLDTRKPKRSLQQNNLLWMYLTNIAEEHYGDPSQAEALYEDFLQQFGKTKVFLLPQKDGTEKRIRKVIGTSQYNKSDFSLFLLKIEEVTGVEIPDTEGYIMRDMEDVMGDNERPAYPTEEVGDIPF